MSAGVAGSYEGVSPASVQLLCLNPHSLLVASLAPWSELSDLDVDTCSGRTKNFVSRIPIEHDTETGMWILNLVRGRAQEGRSTNSSS